MLCNTRPPSDHLPTPFRHASDPVTHPPSPLPAFYKEAPWFVKMAVLLLWERSRGRASPVWGYIEQLPSSIDTPVRWSEAELAELQYAPAVNEVGCWHGPWFLARCLHPCRCVPNLLASAFAHLQAAPL